jgi:hypothetical protein
VSSSYCQEPLLNPLKLEPLMKRSFVEEVLILRNLLKIRPFVNVGRGMKGN